MNTNNISEAPASIPEPEHLNVIDPADVKKYAELSKTEAEAKKAKTTLNTKIKEQLGAFALKTLASTLAPYQLLIDIYKRALENEDNEDLELAAKELEELGISIEMVEDYLSMDPIRCLSHNKIDLKAYGFKVTTTIQDRSAINPDKAMDYFKSIDRKDLIMTKAVVNDAALETAIANGEINLTEFKSIAIDENLVIALSIK